MSACHNYILYLYLYICASSPSSCARRVIAAVMFVRLHKRARANGTQLTVSISCRKSD